MTKRKVSDLVLSFPPGQALASIILAVVLAFCCPGMRLLAYPYTLFIGLPVLAAGVWLNLAAAAALKRHETTIIPFEDSNALVTEGVFGVTRNPIYLGMILLVCGTALLLGAATPWVVCAGFAALMRYRFVLAEERMLAARFGREWREYAARVRRWV